MPDILHQVGIAAAPKKIYEALTTLKGNQGWWDEKAVGDARKGGQLSFFGGWVVFKVMDTRPYRSVKWKCVEGDKTWLGTEIHFHLSRKKGQTFVLFKHAKWKKPVEFMYHCSTKWAVFMLSLKDFAEKGKGRPAPHDALIYVGEKEARE